LKLGGAVSSSPALRGREFRSDSLGRIPFVGGGSHSYGPVPWARGDAAGPGIQKVQIGAVLAAALFSFVTYQDPGERAAVEESESETKRNKEKESGDPPDIDDQD
jgi:hypothetical protein